MWPAHLQLANSLARVEMKSGQPMDTRQTSIAQKERSLQIKALCDLAPAALLRHASVEASWTLDQIVMRSFAFSIS